MLMKLNAIPSKSKVVEMNPKVLLFKKVGIIHVEVQSHQTKLEL